MSVLKQVTIHTVTDEEVGQRIDNFLFRRWKGVPKSHVYKSLRSGEIRIDKRRVSQTHRLALGEIIRIPPVNVAAQQETFIPPNEFPVLLEDDHLLVIDKPDGVAVHGGSGVSFGIIEQLRAARPQARFLELVHRLDSETSGILVLAKKRSALVHLHEQIRSGQMDKRYLALVHGQWRNQRQHVRLPLFKYLTSEGERRVRVQAEGQDAHTIFTLQQSFPDFALLEAELKTGRTHQIRVHLASSGYPIVGDDKYGDFELNRTLCKMGFKRMFLHSCKLQFTHPATHQTISLQASLPLTCQRFLEILSRQEASPT